MGRFREVDLEEQKRLDEEKANKEQEEKEKADRMKVDDRYVLNELCHEIFAYVKTKAQISCTVTAQLISAFVFTTWIEQFFLYLY